MSSKRKLQKLAKYIACDVTSRILYQTPQDVKIDDIADVVFKHLQSSLYQLNFSVSDRHHPHAPSEVVKNYHKRDMIRHLAEEIEKQKVIQEEELDQEDRITTSRYSIIVLKGN